jgi:hypothetical protein
VEETLAMQEDFVRQFFKTAAPGTMASVGPIAGAGPMTGAGSIAGAGFPAFGF